MTQIVLATQGFTRLGMLIGLFILTMPVVIILNLLTKLVAAPTDLSSRRRCDRLRTYLR